MQFITEAFTEIIFTLPLKMIWMQYQVNFLSDVLMV